MTRNEKQTCHDLIEPAIASAGWSWDAQVEIGPSPVNLTGEAMYDPSQRIVADYLLNLWRMPLAVLEAKPEGEPASNGMQQASRYARRLGLRFSIASNGCEYILTDNRTGKYERFETPPSSGDLLKLWIGKSTRKELRAEFKDRDVHVAATACTASTTWSRGPRTAHRSSRSGSGASARCSSATGAPQR